MTTAASYQEIQRAREYIAARGYEVSGHENGHLIVKDPIHKSGTGKNKGLLVPAGFKDVAIRCMADAISFVTART